jgi:hypothetical protein
MCETWSLTLWEEHWIENVSEQSAEEKIYAYEDEVTGEVRKLHMSSFVFFTRYY